MTGRSAPSGTVWPHLPIARAERSLVAGCVLSVDGTVPHTATGAAVLGHHLRALVHLSEHLARRSEDLPAGAVVLAGALTDAVPVRPGAAHRAEIRGLGAVEFVPGTP